MSSYFQPATLQEALKLLKNGRPTVAAGCTDLYPLTTEKTLPGNVLDIMALDELRGIKRTDGYWRIGATTTWADILCANLPTAFDGLKLAAREVGSVQIQNVATIAGNLCTASPAADGAPCLLTLDAWVELQSIDSIRSVPLFEFLTGPRQTALCPDEMVTAILVPEDISGAGHFLKLGARKYLVISIAMVAVRVALDGDRIGDVALAVGSCGPTASRLTDLEGVLLGQPLHMVPELIREDLVAANLSPIDDIRADAGYRITAATELLRRAVRDLTQSARFVA